MSEGTGVAAALTAADIDARYQPTRTRATICLDSDLTLEIERLEERLEQAQRDDSAASPVGEIAQQIIALREQAKAAEVEFVFRAIGRLAFRELQREHKPTDEQKAEADQLGYTGSLVNADTFQPALFAAACEQPTGTNVTWWQAKCREWGDGQIARLWVACIAAQEGVTEVPKAARAYALTRTPDSSSG